MHFSCGSLSLWTMLGLEILAYFNFFLSQMRCATLMISVSASQTMLTGLFEDVRFGPLSNLHTCILLVENYRFGQCLCKRFSPISSFFSLESYCTVRDAPHSRVLLSESQTMVTGHFQDATLALHQIYTRVFHL